MPDDVDIQSGTDGAGGTATETEDATSTSTADSQDTTGVQGTAEKGGASAAGDDAGSQTDGGEDGTEGAAGDDGAEGAAAGAAGKVAPKTSVRVNEALYQAVLARIGRPPAQDPNAGADGDDAGEDSSAQRPQQGAQRQRKGPLPALPEILSDASIAKIRKENDGDQPGGVADALLGVRQWATQLQESLSPVLDGFKALAQERNERNQQMQAQRDQAFEKDLKAAAGNGTAELFGVGVHPSKLNTRQKNMRIAVLNIGAEFYEASQGTKNPLTPGQALAEAVKALTQSEEIPKPKAVQAVREGVKTVARQATIPPGSSGGRSGMTTDPKAARVAKAKGFYKND